MSGIVTCGCGRQYAVRDEDAGRAWRCEVCGRVLAAPPPGAQMAPVPASHATAWAVGIAAAVVAAAGVTLAVVLVGRSRRETPAALTEEVERLKERVGEPREPRDQLRVDQAKAQIRAFEQALERYKLDMGAYPAVEFGLYILARAPDDQDEARKWRGPYIRSVPKDPWGRDYIYKRPSDHNPAAYDLLSFGPDGQEGTEDDITNWAEVESSREAPARPPAPVPDYAAPRYASVEDAERFLFEKLNAAARAAAMEPPNITPLAPRRYAKYAVIGFSLDATCTLEKWLALVKRLEESPDPLRVDAATVIPAGAPRGDALSLRITLRLSALAIVGDGAPAADQAAEIGELALFVGSKRPVSVRRTFAELSRLWPEQRRAYLTEFRFGGPTDVVISGRAQNVQVVNELLDALRASGVFNVPDINGARLDPGDRLGYPIVLQFKFAVIRNAPRGGETGEPKPVWPAPQREQATSPPSAAAGDLTLTGIMQDGAKLIAMFEDKRARRSFFLEKGDPLGGGIIVEIDMPGHYVLLKEGNTERKIHLGESVGAAKENDTSSTRPAGTGTPGEAGSKSIEELMRDRRRREQVRP